MECAVISLKVSLAVETRRGRETKRLMKSLRDPPGAVGQRDGAGAGWTVATSLTLRTWEVEVISIGFSVLPTGQHNGGTRVREHQEAGYWDWAAASTVGKRIFKRFHDKSCRHLWQSSYVMWWGQRILNILGQPYTKTFPLSSWNSHFTWHSGL